MTAAKLVDKPLVLVGNDTDLLVMLIDKAIILIDMQFSPHPPTIYCIHKTQHALHGCDTVSALQNKSKRKAFLILENRTKIDCEMLNVFVDQNAKKDDIAQAGEVFLLRLYGSTHCTSLDEHR